MWRWADSAIQAALNREAMIRAKWKPVFSEEPKCKERMQKHLKVYLHAVGC